MMEQLQSLNRLAFLLGMQRAKLENLAQRAGGEYEWVDLLPKNKSKWRHLDYPSFELRSVQQRIRRGLLSEIALPEHLYGAVKGRSARQAVALHVGAPIVAKVDIRDCFGSIASKAVFNAYRQRLGHSDPVARVLTQLTTRNHALPQGTATSPALANLVLWDLYDAVHALSLKLDFRFSFFVDDIVLSGASVDVALEDVIRQISRVGLAIGRKKTKVMRANTPQTVLGLLSNTRMGIPRHPQPGLRLSIEALQKEMIEASKAGESVGNDVLLSIRSKVTFVSSVNPRQGERLRRHMDKLLPRTGSGPSIGVAGDRFRECRGDLQCWGRPGAVLA